MATDLSTIAHRLEVSRKELLDLGLRNTLLNYRLTKGRGVSMADESPVEVYERLVSGGLSLTFLPQPEEEVTQTEQATQIDTPTQQQAPQNARTRFRRTEQTLQTAHDERSLQSRLLATYYAARTHLEERGVNILFVAIGMLHWFEDDSSVRELKAPLLLVPVELTRTSAREKFSLKYNDEDVEGNLSLSTKLKAEFRIDLPELPDTDDLDVANYLSKVAKAIAGQRRWRVEPNEIALGFFSFAKFLMYRDLEPEHWCSQENPDGNASLAALLRDGFRNESSQISDDAYLDEVVAPDALKQITDADSSQALAMLDVRAGMTLVIQGPPGTGKSQTITNLIADALSRGQRVLFVAEKAAALEVVKRRLDKAGLGDACLDIHSHSANKKAVLGELRRTVQLPPFRPEAGRWSIQHYKRHRDQLNAYCLAVNTPIANTGWTPFQLMGELISVARVRNGASFPQAALAVQQGHEETSEPVTWDRHALDGKQELVERLQTHLGKIGLPKDHIFRVARMQALLPSDSDAIAHCLAKVGESLVTLERAVRDLAVFMGIAARIDRADGEVLARAARRALLAPHLRGVDLRTGDWMAKRDELRHLLECGTKFAEIHRQYDEVIIAEAWDVDLLQTRQVLNTIGRRRWRWISPRYRRARQQVAGLCRGEYSKRPLVQLELVDRVMEAARLRKSIHEQETLASRLYGIQWQSLQSDWGVLSRLTDWVTALYRDVGDGRMPKGLIDFLAGDPALDALSQKVVAVETASPACDQWLPVLFDRLNAVDDTRREIISLDLPTQIAMFGQMAERLPELHDAVMLNNIRAAMEREGLSWVFDVSCDWRDAPRLLVPFFRYTCLDLLLRKAVAERDALRTADGAAQFSSQEAFRYSDTSSLKAAQSELAAAHRGKLPKLTGQGQIGVLLHEFAKRSRHLPIRTLVKQSGRAIQAIKPVFMMSPMSVAAFIPPNTIDFDLVIFDEASQVKPVDAFGAVLRGTQLVVVGDSKQLPPTSFFDSLVGDDVVEDDEENIAADIESILSLTASRGARERMLRWHYRSRHHSLIAVSNQEFYDHRLVVFPSPEPPRRGFGLKFHHLSKTIYDRGGSRSNQLEAEVVARAVMVHAKSSPERTLGVAAFSLQQADAIRDRLERLRRDDPSGESFFAAHEFEPFFVKNLESVQGDERDVVFISVGYGRDSSGGPPSMNFGALNGQGGERRLNVLITRARECCEVFSNLTHDDIDLTRTSSRGVAAFKAFLRYAQTDTGDTPELTEDETESSLEDEVAIALTRAGHEVVRRVGPGSFHIDLAVRDPDRPARYLLGIECDGENYHGSRSSRDRDRLRDEVLQNLGWSIHRIWSVDWFKNPERELRRIVEAVNHARVVPKASERMVPLVGAGLSDPAEEEPAFEEPLRSAELRANAYKVCQLRVELDGTELHEVPARKFADWIRQVVIVEGPVHMDEVVRRIADAAGVQRVGNRISAAFESGVQAAVRANAITKRKGFLWPADMSTPFIRDRSQLENAARRLDLVCNEEIAEAVVHIVRSCFGMDLPDIPAATCDLLGFARTSGEMASTVHRVALQLVKAGRLQQENGHITFGAGSL